MTQCVVFSRFAFCFIASAILLIKLSADLFIHSMFPPPGLILFILSGRENLVKEGGAAVGRSGGGVREE